MELYYLPFSPWSLKARFALAHHAIEVERCLYTPILDEPKLRLRLRKLGGRLTVPILFTPEGPITDSFEIALYADRVGRGSPLIPSSQRSTIEAWNAWSERVLDAGRARSMVRAGGSIDAAIETLPDALRDRPRVASAVARLGFGLFKRKYGILERDVARHGAAIRRDLDELRAAIADGRRHLLSEFSYADVSVALALQALRPLSASPMGPGLRAAATDVELADAYPDLLRWRDALDDEHSLLASTS